MKDRVPTYPGRVKLVPVAGQTNIYDMTRADSPTQEGTPLNKATFLQDATAAAIGLTSDDPTVNEALLALFNAANSKAKIATGSYVGTGTYGSGNPNTLTFDFEPKIVVIWPSTQLYSGAIYGGQVWLSPMSEGIGSVSSGLEYYLCNLAWSGNTLSFYCTNAEKQLNSSGNTYYYAAIG